MGYSVRRPAKCPPPCASVQIREGARILMAMIDNIDVVTARDTVKPKDTITISITVSQETFDRLCLWQTLCEGCEPQIEYDRADDEELAGV